MLMNKNERFSLKKKKKKKKNGCRSVRISSVLISNFERDP